jgi:hypothetical protein
MPAARLLVGRRLPLLLPASDVATDFVQHAVAALVAPRRLLRIDLVAARSVHAVTQRAKLVRP